jgi:hypothetical protein
MTTLETCLTWQQAGVGGPPAAGGLEQEDGAAAGDGLLLCASAAGSPVFTVIAVWGLYFANQGPRIGGNIGTGALRGYGNWNVDGAIIMRSRYRSTSCPTDTLLMAEPLGLASESNVWSSTFPMFCIWSGCVGAMGCDVCGPAQFPHSIFGLPYCLDQINWKGLAPAACSLILNHVNSPQ